MDLEKDIRAALDSMILSASGWRGVFALDGDEQSKAGGISDAHSVIAAAAAHCFAGFLQSEKALVFVGTDTRPTGKAIAQAVVAALLCAGCTVKWAGFSAIPEIMAWAAALDTARGFIYISASHNPIGHNGFKFGLAGGGVLPPEENAALSAGFLSFLEKAGNAENIRKSISGLDPARLRAVFSGEADAKKEALRAYFNFSSALQGPALQGLKTSLAQKPLGIVCDFNGSARSVSIDREFFTGLGLGFKAIHDRPGEIAHGIIPEGGSLEPCRKFLEEVHDVDRSFILGYTPDCDGDRGNLVIWDEALSKARALEAQEVFALACVAELSYMAWTGEIAWDNKGKSLSGAALVVNDPTSLRIEKIASAFGVQVFRAEVGEANVVGLARKLREQGFTVRILGEGSNGGCIIHPSAVRDPLNTVMSLIKLLALKSENNRPGPFELWCNVSGQTALYNDNFGPGEIIASLPPFATTGVNDEMAVLKIKTRDHGLLKNRYQQIFLADWEKKRESLKNRYGICAWEAAAYNGTEEKRGIMNFGEAAKGGLKICFFNEAGLAAASIWMRGSATEPVFRIMADAAGNGRRMERELLEWQYRMVLEADKA